VNETLYSAPVTVYRSRFEHQPVVITPRRADLMGGMLEVRIKIDDFRYGPRDLPWRLPGLREGAPLVFIGEIQLTDLLGILCPVQAQDIPLRSKYGYALDIGPVLEWVKVPGERLAPLPRRLIDPVVPPVCLSYEDGQTGGALVACRTGWFCKFCIPLGKMASRAELAVHFSVYHGDECWVEEEQEQEQEQVISKEVSLGVSRIGRG
jgi:hypothetical protein